MENEIFEWIPGYENLYKISNFGNVLSFHKNKNGELLKSSKNKNGYMILGLTENKKTKLKSVHRIVCQTFHGEPPTQNHVVNHKDGNKQNNFADNLEWCTSGENTKHAWETGLAKSYNRNISAAERNSMNGRGYVEVRFKLTPEEFAVYQAKADEIEKEYGIKTSATAQIKAVIVKDAEHNTTDTAAEKLDVMSVFDDMEN